jgi:hypothetical protein
MNKKYSLGLALAPLIVGIILGFMLKKEHGFTIYKPVKEVITLHDTVVHVVTSKPVSIHRAKAKITKQSDSVLKANPFIASLDTLTNKDTIKASYEYPENLFSLEVNRKPDSIRVEKLTKIETIKEEKPWWENAGWFTGGTIVGIIVGLIISK